MKALVTGGNGFVGSHLVEALCARGDEPTCLVRETSDLRWLDGLPVKYVYGDITRPESLPEAVADCPVVFHLAGTLRGKDAAAYYRVNEQGTRNLIEAWTRHCREPQRFVYCASLAGAGPTTRDRRLSEDDPPKPITDYGRSKLAGETAVREVARGDFSYAILRPPAIYGPRETDILTYFKLIQRGVAPRLGSGRQRFDLLYVGDLVEALLALAEHPNADGKTFYANDGGTHDWIKVSDGIAEALGKRPLRFSIPLGAVSLVARVSELVASLRNVPAVLHRQKVNELRQEAWICDATRIGAELGFAPKVDAKAGFEETARWYRRQGWI